MIQRIQSIYLLFAGLLIAALYLFPIVHTVYAGVIPVNIRVTGIYQDAGGAQIHTQTFLALTIVTAIIALLPIGVIFLYKNRKQQLALCYSTLLVILGYSFWVAQTVKDAVPGAAIHTNNYGIGLFLTPISILLMFVAIRSIKNDERLVRSADRLR
ncbi:DUF4293 domain-containing protein [Mucilaginibacter koreensis]